MAKKNEKMIEKFMHDFCIRPSDELLAIHDAIHRIMEQRAQQMKASVKKEKVTHQ